MENIFALDIELYENQRYMPLSGWSSKGLMLTDRSAYSTEDGTSRFSNTEEATKQLTSEGQQHRYYYPKTHVLTLGWRVICCSTTCELIKICAPSQSLNFHWCTLPNNMLSWIKFF